MRRLFVVRRKNGEDAMALTAWNHGAAAVEYIEHLETNMNEMECLHGETVPLLVTEANGEDARMINVTCIMVPKYFTDECYDEDDWG